MLARKGFTHIEAVTSVEQLVRIARRPDVGVILLDLALAGMAGLGIVATLRAVAPGSAIVLLCPFSGLRAAAVEAGVYDFVDPHDLRDLDRCLDRLVAESESNGQRPGDNGSREPSTGAVPGPGPVSTGRRRTKAFRASPSS